VTIKNYSKEFGEMVRKDYRCFCDLGLGRQVQAKLFTLVLEIRVGGDF
jgi:hypothetical protein